MNIEDFFNLFLVLSSVHGFIFCSFNLLSKREKSRTVIFINLLVLSISLNNFQSWVLVKDFFRANQFLKYFEIPWHFLIAPFFYLFLIHYIGITRKKFNILKIIVPTFILLLLIRFGFSLTATNQEFYISSIFRKYVIIEEVISSIFSLLIFILSFKIYESIKTSENQDSIRSFDDLSWIGNFFNLGLLVYVFWFIPLIISIGLDFKVFMPSYYPLRVFTTVLIYALGYYSLIKIKTIEERKYLREYLTKPVNSTPEQKVVDFKIKKQIQISQEVIDGILEGLKQFEDKKLYTNQNASLVELAKTLNTNTNYLSKVINVYKKTNFTNYINTLRIENIVNELINNPKIRKFTIKAIAQEAGYSSSDSFSKVFHKLKGENPSEFIKKL